MISYKETFFRDGNKKKKKKKSSEWELFKGEEILFYYLSILILLPFDPDKVDL